MVHNKNLFFFVFNLTKLTIHKLIIKIPSCLAEQEMDDLEKQLQQLQLLNNRDLSPKPPQGLLLKKVAPEIPPKPKKNQKNQSQVFVIF